MQVKISTGNSKLGKIANISLPPVLTCRADAPCAQGACYALKGVMRFSKAAKAAWGGNLEMYRKDPSGYFQQIVGYVLNKKPPRFRWHVGGDIVDQMYFEGVLDTAVECPETEFLVFTKKYDIVNAYVGAFDIPINLTVVFSAWPGLALDNPHGLPIAWMQDGTEDRVPAGTEGCAGSCVDCSNCWGRSKGVAFHKH